MSMVTNKSLLEYRYIYIVLMTFCFMEIITIYNTPIRLEEGDFIALDPIKRRLWIRSGDKLYVACESADRLRLDGMIHVSSAGYFSREKELLPKMDWKEYVLATSKTE